MENRHNCGFRRTVVHLYVTLASHDFAREVAQIVTVEAAGPFGWAGGGVTGVTDSIIAAKAGAGRASNESLAPVSRRRLLMLVLAGAGGAAALVAGAAPGVSTASSAQPLAPRAIAAAYSQVPPAPPEPDYKIKMTVAAAAGDTLQQLLLRAGVAAADAMKAGKLAKAHAELEAGTEITLLLGDKGPAEGRSLRGLAYQPRMELQVQMFRDQDDQLRLVTQAIAIDATPRRFRGKARDSLYWSMRAVGVPPEFAGQYLEALSDRLGAGRRSRPDDEFDLVIDHRLAATGETKAGPILYAALDRSSGPDVRLVRWTVARREGLYEPGRTEQRSEGLHRPVAGSVSSRFGTRIHPILRFARFHRGVDYRANWGSPVYAAEDGAVVIAGWKGGYGRQVRLAHGSGLQTSYSHLSEVAVASGSRVRKGQIIGYVGSTGFSTGPHLHYEVWRNGQALDPLSMRQSGTVIIAPAELAALNARLRQLQSI